MPLAKEIRTFQLQSPKVLIFSLRVRSISAAILGTVLFSLVSRRFEGFDYCHFAAENHFDYCHFDSDYLSSANFVRFDLIRPAVIADLDLPVPFFLPVASAYPFARLEPFAHHVPAAYGDVLHHYESPSPTPQTA